jgi:hypothetical protein
MCRIVSIGSVPVLLAGSMPILRKLLLPRMADFALWATACETALWPAGTFMRAYEENRRAAIEALTRIIRRGDLGEIACVETTKAQWCR